jgi:hypothetical protein
VSANLCAGGARLHTQGVQERVQHCGFVRGSRGACNPMVAPCQILPATNEEWSGMLPGPFFIGQGTSTGCGREFAQARIDGSCRRNYVKEPRVIPSFFRFLGQRVRTDVAQVMGIPASEGVFATPRV